MGKFRDVLRIEERAIFEDLMDECRRFASAAGAGCFPVKTEGMFPSILLAHQKSLSELHDKLDSVSTLLSKPVGKVEEGIQNSDHGHLIIKVAGNSP
jgi:hypothetical protein